MRIVVDEAIPDARLLFAGLGDLVLMPGRAISRASLADADALVVRSVTRVNAGLLAGSRVRFVGTATSGTDHIDVGWLAAAGITFVDAAGCNSQAVAEYVLAALLGMDDSRGFALAKRTLGVIGAGRIGSRLVALGSALGMHVAVCDPPLEQASRDSFPSAIEQSRAVPSPVEFGVRFISLNDLAAQSDIITLHVPLTRDGPCPTANMIDAAVISRMRPGAILINTSRGEVVCEEALLAAMAGGRLAAAILDVWRNEPAIDAALLERATVATPHVAGYTVEARRRGAEMVRDALRDFLRTPLRTHDASRGSPGQANGGNVSARNTGHFDMENLLAADARSGRILEKSNDFDVFSPEYSQSKKSIMPPLSLADQTALWHAVRAFCDPAADARRFREAAQRDGAARAFDAFRSAYSTRREVTPARCGALPAGAARVIHALTSHSPPKPGP